jgi:hypothetical protein
MKMLVLSNCMPMVYLSHALIFFVYFQRRQLYVRNCDVGRIKMYLNSLFPRRETEKGYVAKKR